MRSQKQFNTTKLFYKKYYYKIVLDLRLNYAFTCLSHERKHYPEKLGYVSAALKKAKKLDESATINLRSLNVSPSDYKDAEAVYNLLLKADDFKIRVGFGREISVYSNDISLIEALANCTTKCPSEFYEPESEDTIKLLQTPNVIITHTIKDFAYKITIGGNKIDTNFATWLSANRDKCRVTDRTIRAISKNHWITGLYFYIRDDKVLMFVNMMISDNIKRVDKMIYKSNKDK